MKWTQQETGLKQAQNVEFLFRWEIFKLIPLYVFFAISTFIFVEYYLRFFQQINSNWTQNWAHDRAQSYKAQWLKAIDELSI